MKKIATDKKTAEEYCSSSTNQSSSKKRNSQTKKKKKKAEAIIKFSAHHQTSSHEVKYKKEFEELVKLANKHIKSEVIWANRKPHKYGFGTAVVEIVFKLIIEKQLAGPAAGIYLYAFDPGMCLTLAEIIAIYREEKKDKDEGIVLYVSATDERSIVQRQDYKKFLSKDQSILFGSKIWLEQQDKGVNLSPNRIYVGIEDLNVEDETCHPISENPTSIVFFCHEPKEGYLVSLKRLYLSFVFHKDQNDFFRYIIMSYDMYCLINRDRLILPNKNKYFIAKIGSYTGKFKDNGKDLVVCDKRPFLLFKTTDVVKNIYKNDESDVTKEKLEFFKTNLKNVIYESILFEYDKFFGTVVWATNEFVWRDVPVNIISSIKELLQYSCGLLEGEPKYNKHIFIYFHIIVIFIYIIILFILKGEPKLQSNYCAIIIKAIFQSEYNEKNKHDFMSTDGRYYRKIVRFFDPTTYVAYSEVPKSLKDQPDKVMVTELELGHIQNVYVLKGAKHESSDKFYKVLELLKYVKEEAIKKRITSEKFWMNDYKDTTVMRGIKFDNQKGVTRSHLDNNNEDVSEESDINEQDVLSEKSGSSDGADSNFDDGNFVELEGEGEGEGEGEDEDLL